MQSGLWDVMTGQVLPPLQGSADADNYAISENGRVAAGVGRDGSLDDVHVWNTATGKQLRQWTFPALSGAAIFLSDDGKLLAVGQDSTRFPRSPKILLWRTDANTNVPLAQLSYPLGNILWLSFRRDDRRLYAVTTTGRLFVWGRR